MSDLYLVGFVPFLAIALVAAPLALWLAFPVLSAFLLSRIPGSLSFRDAYRVKAVFFGFFTLTASFGLEPGWLRSSGISLIFNDLLFLCITPLMALDLLITHGAWWPAVIGATALGLLSFVAYRWRGPKGKRAVLVFAAVLGASLAPLAVFIEARWLPI